MAAQGYLRHVACAGFIHGPQVPRPYLSYATPDSKDLRLSSGLPLLKRSCRRDSHHDAGVLPPHLGHLGPHALTRRIAVPRAGSCLEWTAHRSNQIFRLGASRRRTSHCSETTDRRPASGTKPLAQVHPQPRQFFLSALRAASLDWPRGSRPSTPARYFDAPRAGSSLERAGQIKFFVSALRAAGPLHRSETTDRLPASGTKAPAHHFDAPRDDVWPSRERGYKHSGGMLIYLPGTPRRPQTSSRASRPNTPT
ncbi:hypothetical protein B0H15DRAFT_945808 [Mycena belliarum]|uniref:Uncharacterized protein n=1 Tax=Mycena belliarum TaxID=1033014 RepID=A0AAD6UAE6_9AGAR|nr:hypothetical protein B0H15DRAFT_945808 [Mycena belliae]